MSIDHICQYETVFDYPVVLDDLKSLDHIFQVVYCIT